MDFLFGAMVGEPTVQPTLFIQINMHIHFIALLLTMKLSSSSTLLLERLFNKTHQGKRNRFTYFLFKMSSHLHCMKLIDLLKSKPYNNFGLVYRDLSAHNFNELSFSREYIIPHLFMYGLPIFFPACI